MEKEPSPSPSQFDNQTQSAPNDDQLQEPFHIDPTADLVDPTDTTDIPIKTAEELILDTNGELEQLADAFATGAARPPVSARSKTGEKIDEFFRLDEPVSPIVEQVLQRQGAMQQVRSIVGDGPEYRARIARDSEFFVDQLSSSAIRNNPEQITLSREGFDLIENGLYKNGAPDTKTLLGVRKVLEAQEIVPVTLVENPDAENGFDIIPGHQDPERNLRYMIKTDEGFVPLGPYKDKGSDTVANVLKMAEPEHWLLPDEKRERYERIVGLDRLVDGPKDYVPGPQKYGVAKPFRGVLEAKRLEKHQASQPEVDEDLVQFSKEIVAMYQKRGPKVVQNTDGSRTVDYGGNAMIKKSGIENKASTLRAVKEQIQPHLDRDIELQYMAIELRIDDDSTEPLLERVMKAPEIKHPDDSSASKTIRRDLVERLIGAQLQIQEELNNNLIEVEAWIAQERQVLEYMLHAGHGTMTQEEIDQHLRTEGDKKIDDARTTAQLRRKTLVNSV